jgi:hypothetical protein
LVLLSFGRFSRKLSIGTIKTGETDVVARVCLLILHGDQPSRLMVMCGYYCLASTMDVDQQLESGIAPQQSARGLSIFRYGQWSQKTTPSSDSVLHRLTSPVSQVLGFRVKAKHINRKTASNPEPATSLSAKSDAGMFEYTMIDSTDTCCRGGELHRS